MAQHGIAWHSMAWHSMAPSAGLIGAGAGRSPSTACILLISHEAAVSCSSKLPCWSALQTSADWHQKSVVSRCTGMWRATGCCCVSCSSKLPCWSALGNINQPALTICCVQVYRHVEGDRLLLCVAQLKPCTLTCSSKHQPTDIRVVLCAGVQACGGRQAAAVCPAELQCRSAVQGIGCCGDHHRAHGQISGPPHPPCPGLPPSLA